MVDYFCMQSFLVDYSILHPIFTYILIFFGIAIEGDVVLFTSAFLADQGYVNPFVIVIITLLGVFVRDISWYEIGRRVSASESRVVAKAREMAEPFDDHLKDRLFHSVFVAKFVYGLHLAIIMRIGSLKLPIKEFIRADALATVVWIFVVGGLGYLSSESVAFFSAQKYLKYTEVALAAGIVLYMILHRYISRYSKKFLK